MSVPVTKFWSQERPLETKLDPIIDRIKEKLLEVDSPIHFRAYAILSEVASFHLVFTTSDRLMEAFPLKLLLYCLTQTHGVERLCVATYCYKRRFEEPDFIELIEELFPDGEQPSIEIMIMKNRSPVFRDSTVDSQMPPSASAVSASEDPKDD